MAHTHEHHKEHDEDCAAGGGSSCGCCHSHEDGHGDHEHEHGEETSVKKIIISAVLFVLALLVHKLPLFSYEGPVAKGNATVFLVIHAAYLALYFGAYLVSGLHVLREAVEGLLHKQIFGEEFLMSVATVGAIAMGEFSEAVAVMILFQIGECLEDFAVEKSRHSIKSLMDIRPDKATVRRDGKEETVLAQDVGVGETIVVRPGERVPLDGIVVSGKSFVDTSALTGESVPREVFEQCEILSGCVNTSGVLEIKVTKPFSESTVSRVLDMVETAQNKKARSEKFITRFARVYTPVVCIIAVALAVVPSVILGGGSEVWRTWIYRALELLVVSCPCALVISVPLSFFAGIGLSSKNGILVKGSNYIEMLSQIKTVVFDKTGTLTKGVFEVTGIYPLESSGISRDELLAYATHAECGSNHPISLSLKTAHHCDVCETLTMEQVEELSGQGVRTVVQGKTVCAGNARLMQSQGVKDFTLLPQAQDAAGTLVHVAVDGTYCGFIVISDVEKSSSREAVAALKKCGVERTVMLTGDAAGVAQKVSENLGINKFYAELLPQDKVHRLEEELSLYEATKKRVAFVGDGINDAPVLSRSDVGIAMGALGSDSAIEAADVVIMDDNLMKISLAIRLAKKSMANVRQNLLFALGVKTLIMILCALGIANMWAAVFSDVGVTMLAVLNSMRLLWFGTRK